MSVSQSKNLRTPKRVGSRESGFTLIEVLVAVLVLSIGLLGLAGLQTTSLRNNNSAYMRSQAAILAYDMSDRMRANRDAAAAGAYDLDLTSTYTGEGSVAADDLDEWMGNLTAILPQGQGEVARAGSAVTVTVQWDDTRGVEAPKAFSVETQL